jgi:hypothetical protein
LALFVSGCTTTVGGVAPSSEPLAPGSYSPVGKAVGTSWGVHLLGFIPIVQPSTADALTDAIEDRRADALLQVTAETGRCWHLLVVVLERIKVEGMAVTLKKPAP